MFSVLFYYSARKSKTHILVPRAVARKGEGGGEGKKERSGGDTKNKLSNEDFRKLLMEK